MRSFLALFTILFFLFCPLTIAAKEKTAKNDEPEVKVTVPTSYILKRIALFPVELPGFVIHAVVWPLDKGLNYMERKHVTERVADALSNKEKTFWVYPIIVGGAGSSFGLGVGLKHTNLFNKGYHLDASTNLRINLDQYFDASFSKPNAFDIFNYPASYSVNFDYKGILGADYYGKGSGSLRSNQSDFSYYDIETHFTLSYDFFYHLGTRAQVGFIYGYSGPPERGSHPSVDITFPAAEISGFNRWTPYFKFGLMFYQDTRDNTMSTQKGGFRALSFERYQSMRSGNYDYNQYTLDVHHFFPLWKPGLVFAVRNIWTFQQATGGSTIPFYRMAVLDAYSPLRGFKRGRFRDTASVLFNFEYRYPISHMLEGLIFVDTGRVFNGINNFAFKQFKYSVGGGLNVRLFRYSFFRLRAAYGGEGINFIFGLTKQIEWQRFY